jgi:hypothetical protein
MTASKSAILLRNRAAKYLVKHVSADQLDAGASHGAGYDDDWEVHGDDDDDDASNCDDDDDDYDARSHAERANHS